MCVIDGLKSIKPGKQDGNYGLTSDHLINSSNTFKMVLSMVMSSMMVHGYNAHSCQHGPNKCGTFSSFRWLPPDIYHINIIEEPERGVSIGEK